MTIPAQSDPTTRTNSTISRLFARLISLIIRRSARLLTGARSVWLGCAPEMKQRIYYANHTTISILFCSGHHYPKRFEDKPDPLQHRITG